MSLPLLHPQVSPPSLHLCKPYRMVTTFEILGIPTAALQPTSHITSTLRNRNRKLNYNSSPKRVLLVTASLMLTLTRNRRPMLILNLILILFIKSSLLQPRKFSSMLHNRSIIISHGPSRTSSSIVSPFSPSRRSCRNSPLMRPSLAHSEEEQIGGSLNIVSPLRMQYLCCNDCLPVSH